jgi:cytochrome oxidase assembly protein ShyY1
MEDSAQREMPKYQSHKKVWALKIAKIDRDIDAAKEQERETDGSAIITPADEGYGAFTVDGQYMHKHNPQVGGYYVVYQDGYKSFSPAEAFEDGYTRI